MENYLYFNMDGPEVQSKSGGRPDTNLPSYLD